MSQEVHCSPEKLPYTPRKVLCYWRESTLQLDGDTETPATPDGAAPCSLTPPVGDRARGQC